MFSQHPSTYLHSEKTICCQEKKAWGVLGRYQAREPEAERKNPLGPAPGSGRSGEAVVTVDVAAEFLLIAGRVKGWLH